MAQFHTGGETPLEPIEIHYRGMRCWRFANGRILPIIAGGSTDAGDGGAGDGGSGDRGAGAGDGGNSSDGGSGDGASSDGDADKTTDPKVKAARDEAVAERKKRQDLETQLTDVNKRLKDFEDKDKSDLEKAQGDATTAAEVTEKLERENRSLRLQAAFAVAGREAGALYPENLWRFADDASIDVEIDDDGRVKNADKVVGKLREAMPEMFGKKKPSGSADQGARRTSDDKDVKPGSDRLRRAYAKD